MRFWHLLILALSSVLVLGQAGYEVGFTNNPPTGESSAVASEYGEAFIATSLFDGFIVTKVDSTGAVLWSRRFLDEALALESLAILGDGVVVLSDHDPPGSDSRDIVVRRISADAAVEWVLRIDRLDLHNRASCIRTDNAGLLIVGSVLEDQTGWDQFLVRLTNDGTFVNAASYAGLLEERLFSSVLLAGGGALLVGEAALGLTNDVLISRVDQENNHLWSRRMHFGVRSFASCAFEDTLTGDLYIGGSTSGYLSGVDHRCFISKLDSTGEHQWTRLLYGTYSPEGFGRRASDRFCAATTIIDGMSAHGDDDIILFEFNTAGSLTANRCYGNADYQHCTSIAPVGTGGLLLSASSGGLRDPLLLKQPGGILDDLCTGVSIPVAWQTVEPLITDTTFGIRIEATAAPWQAPMAYSLPVREFICCPFEVVSEFMAEPTADPNIWHFQSESTGTGELEWNFGSAESDLQYEFISPGIYEVCLTINGICSSSTSCQNILVGSLVLPVANETVEIGLDFNANSAIVKAPSGVRTVSMISVDGRIAMSLDGRASNVVELAIDDLAGGVYLVHVVTGAGISSCRVLIPF